jgi:hypothetical protein
MGTSASPVVNQDGAQDWRATLPPEMQSEKSLEKFKGVGDVAKAYTELEKKMGSAIKIPGSDAKPEELDQFYSKLGRPESPDKYEFKLPDLPEGIGHDEEMQAAFKSMAHKAGLSPRQAQILMDEYSAVQLKRITEFQNADKQTVEVLKKEWGADYEKNLGLAQRAVMEAGGQALKDELDATGLGNSPLLAKHFASLGAKTAESTLIIGDTQVGMSEADVLAKIHEIQNDPKHPYNNTRAEPRLREAAFQQMTKLHEQALAARGR